MIVASIALSLTLLIPGGCTAELGRELKELKEHKEIVSVPERRMIPIQSVPSGGTHVQPSRTYSGNGADIIRSVAAEHGCSGEEVRMLLSIAHHESTHRPHAVSPTGKYVGLFQLGPHLGSYEQRIDPHWNTARAIRYMRGRYGSIAGAYHFRNANNWY